MLRSFPTSGKRPRSDGQHQTLMAAEHSTIAEPVTAAGGRATSSISPTPLRAVFAFTFLNSIGSAVIYAGVFFLAKHHYAFERDDNFKLALLYGLTYIPAALFVAPLLRRLARVGVAPRAYLVFVMLAMAALAWLPWAGSITDGDSAAATSPPSRWPMWVMVGLYSPLSGSLWPIVESFLAGGRHGHDLRSATGKFNICWSSAIAIALLAMSPLVQAHALLVLQVLGGVHVLAALALIGFQPRPAAHEHEQHAPRPVVYHQLLGVLRLLLPIAFMFIATLSPYLPSALGALEIPVARETVIASSWYFTRVLTFWAMERWHGWHGRWSTPIAGGVVLLAGFAGVVLAPALGPGGFGTFALLGGLAAFGVGVGIIYAAALYYAMEVGSSGVDAGGIHETLIGIGYSAGPACGLLASGLVAGAGGPGVRSANFEIAMLGVVSALALVVTGVAVWRAIGHSRRRAA